MVKAIFNGKYFVDEEGCFYSCNKYKNITPLVGKVCKKTGYKTILFSFNGVRKYALAHRVVAEAFIPNPKNLKEVNHIDGNKTNNAVCNLEWVSTRENQLHCRDTLFNANHKITYEIAEKIREEKLNKKLTHRELGDKYGLSKTHVGYILKHQRWAMS